MQLDLIIPANMLVIWHNWESDYGGTLIGDYDED